MIKDTLGTGAEWRFPRRVAYVVNHSLPYSSDGYAVRTHEVARALTALGHEVLVINRPGRPWDIEGFAAETQVPPSQTVDGVRYLFLPSRATPDMPLRARLRQAEKMLLEAFEVFRPGAVLAVSNWENAEPALYAARRWGAPFFYEKRGFWEMSQAAQDPAYAESEAYRRAQENEIRIARAARAVFVLNPAMRDELERRGVDPAKVQLAPNGVTPPARAPRGPSRADLGITARHLLGYVGSLAGYEGSEDLLKVLARLRGDGLDVALLVVGSNAAKGLVGSDSAGTAREVFSRAAESLGVAEHVHLVGQVSYAQTGAYYALLDALVMTRRRTPVTQLVTPLKPYAAAAHGVPVFMPDMPPLDEVARDIHGSLYPEGDLDRLAAMLRETLERGGHPAVVNPMSPDILWQQRVRPIARMLRAATEGLADPATLFAATPGKVATLATAETAAQATRFDAATLPQVALRGRTAAAPVAAIGPCRDLPGAPPAFPLTRVNILGELATRSVGRFVIDWAGLQRERGEWDGLWSIENMRLNRLVMDACAIAQDRGWQIQVIGPVSRSRAPLYRTVARLFDEILPTGQGMPEETP